MISQRCPKCFSKRIRRGYRPTPLWSKFLFRYNLLCDSCNWEFTGFAVPGTVSARSDRKLKKVKVVKKEEISNIDEEISSSAEPENVISLDGLQSPKTTGPKKVKVRNK